MFYQFKGQTRRRKRSPLQRRKRNAYISETTRWTEGVIPYVVDTNAFSKSISNIPCAAKSLLGWQQLICGRENYASWLLIQQYLNVYKIHWISLTNV